MTYYALDRETREYTKDKKGKHIVFSQTTKESHEKLCKLFKIDRMPIIFIPVPEPDSEKNIKTYQGGVNDGD